MTDRLLGTTSAKVVLASHLGLIDAGVELALNALRNTFAHIAECASLADPSKRHRLVEVVEGARANLLWRH